MYILAYKSKRQYEGFYRYKEFRPITHHTNIIFRSLVFFKGKKKKNIEENNVSTLFLHSYNWALHMTEINFLCFPHHKDGMH